MLTYGNTKENYILVSQDALSSGRDSKRSQTLHQHLDWKGLHTTVHDMCKKSPTCQIAKTTNQKYGKLQPKQAETNPWETVCVDLIGPYMISNKEKKLLK